MKAVHVLLALTLLATDALASTHNAVRHHPRGNHVVSRRAEKRMNKRSSCTPPSSSSLISSSASTSSTTSSTTTTKATTTSTQKQTTTSSSKTSTYTSSVKAVNAASGFTPGKLKAGTSSGDGLSHLGSNIGWYYDWTPDPSPYGNLETVPMLWGDGDADSVDNERVQAFKKISQAPQFMLGFEEPDCPSGSGSAGMSVSQGVSAWEEYIAPFQAKGTKLGSPSMCHQAAETWLQQFSQEISTYWDFTNIHVNKNSMSGVQEDLDHYASYGKPIWISEFACVDDSNGFVPCTDQGEIDSFINDIVALFEGDSRVAAYAYSNGEGLGDVWPMTNSDGSLSASGQTYLNAIKQYA
uniref:Asl1-like glycosyl hydrolase catalytic domain-containing protein n=1 Tax=Mycena chlorophos TaxID=658473 RepID=A0ABQ0MBE0_MYCCL|nr:predicted protein [Mycena chlorophos]